MSRCLRRLCYPLVCTSVCLSVSLFLLCCPLSRRPCLADIPALTVPFVPHSHANASPFICAFSMPIGAHPKRKSYRALHPAPLLADSPAPYARPCPPLVPCGCRVQTALWKNVKCGMCTFDSFSSFASHSHTHTHTHIQLSNTLPHTHTHTLMESG